MGEEEWTEMCKSLITAALSDGETDFVVDLFIPLMGWFISHLSAHFGYELIKYEVEFTICLLIVTMQLIYIALYDWDDQ